ncbi:MAG: hypothetical protein MSG64_05295 [Pyrinomonadaceae bacterium MAG19_C2-C3]|nr:hypothetical protein [Pyrinomonadaceae bacterium MAG19_C2-C3]
MGSADSVLSLLKNFNYNVVRLPRTDIKPLQLFEKQDNDLVFLGDVSDLFMAGNAPLPQISADEQAAFINGKRSGSLKLNVGLSILGGIIGAMGGSKFGVDVGFNKANALAFEFNDVKMNRIKRTELEKYLLAAKIDPSLGPTARLLEADKLYIVTNTIKSKKFTTEAITSSGTSVGVDVPVIQQAVGASVGVKKEGSSTSKVTFEGSMPLVFGFQAIRLVYDKGVFREAKNVGTDVGMKDIDEDGDDVEMLMTDSPFVPVYGLE